MRWVQDVVQHRGLFGLKASKDAVSLHSSRFVELRLAGIQGCIGP